VIGPPPFVGLLLNMKMPETFRLMFGSNLTEIPANRVKPMNTTNPTLSKILILNRTAFLLLHLRELIGLVSVLKYGLKYDSNALNHYALISLSPHCPLLDGNPHNSGISHLTPVSSALSRSKAYYPATRASIIAETDIDKHNNVLPESFPKLIALIHLEPKNRSA
jgi:hypothetical protein